MTTPSPRARKAAKEIIKQLETDETGGRVTLVWVRNQREKIAERIQSAMDDAQADECVKGHRLEAGRNGATRHSHYYTVISADMPKSTHNDKVFAGFVEENMRDWFLRAWNKTRLSPPPNPEPGDVNPASIQR